ncbi:SPW repeat protein [Planosporangium thailandense]|uniref:SPW repeat protein n=1 Tax=Planosporangium thailandense TaxID=765197 RepID=A0ABX0Y4K2_9ACTN|nr:SPW repeat protein [Planosporangium thailandense]NJC73335.1 SPW repeat protein [Planosporangium thailandense]
MVRPSVSIEDHPEIAELRERFDRVAETPAAKSVDSIAVLAGVWLAISPWVVNFRGFNFNLAVNDLITGIAVAIMGLAFATVWGRSHGLSFTVPVIGLWTIAAPWAVRGGAVTAGTLANNVATGLVILAVGLAAASMARTMKSPVRR